MGNCVNEKFHDCHNPSSKGIRLKEKLITNFEKFITFTVVVHVKNEKEFSRLLKYLQSQPLSYVTRFTHQTYDKIRSNAGILKIPDGELAIEYQMGKGLTSGTVKSYANYGREVMTVDDLIERGGLISD